MAANSNELAAKRRSRRLRRRMRIAAVASLLLAATWAVWFSSLLAATEVQVIGNRLATTESVLTAAGIAVGTPIARIDAVALAAAVTKIPAVESVEVRRVFPHRVILAVQERVPVAVFQTGSAWQLVDRHGIVFGLLPERPDKLILIKGSSAAGRAEAATVAVALPAWLVAQLQYVDGQTKDDVRMQLNDGRLVLFGNAEDASRKLQVLKALLGIVAKTYDVSAPDMPTTRG